MVSHVLLGLCTIDGFWDWHRAVYLTTFRYSRYSSPFTGPHYL